MGSFGSGEFTLITYETNVDNGNTDTIFSGPVSGSRIKGFCKADQDLTIKIYPGAKNSSNTITYGAPTSVSVSAGVTDDDGAGWDLSMIAPYCKITINNASGTNTTSLFLYAQTKDIS